MKLKLPYEATGKAIKGYTESVTAKTETNDCVVRAFASSFEVSYDTAHKFIAEEFKRKPRCGTFGTVPKLLSLVDNGFKINNKKIQVVGKRTNMVLMGSLEYPVKVNGNITMRKMTVGTFIKKNPKGTFFVLVTGHAFTIKDGVVIGNYEDAIKTKRPMRCAFEVK
jgi:hypothetical protein